MVKDPCVGHPRVSLLSSMVKNPFDFLSGDDEACPARKGWCVNGRNHYPQESVEKLNDVDGNTEEAQRKCLLACHSKPGATGCQVWLWPSHFVTTDRSGNLRVGIFENLELSFRIYGLTKIQ